MASSSNKNPDCMPATSGGGATPDNLHELPSGREAGQADMVAELERLIERVKAGDFRALVIMGLGPTPGDDNYLRDVGFPLSYTELVGALAQMQMRVQIVAWNLVQGEDV